MTRRKRIEIAIDALADLRARYPRAALVVTGGPGAHNPSNVAYERELVARAGPGVHLFHAEGVRLGPRELADLYGLADALVLPSDCGACRSSAPISRRCVRWPAATRRTCR
jgi:glycosyltransferase involved in cell wall biosynthesis